MPAHERCLVWAGVAAAEDRKQLKKVELWCDGACSGNPGVGGWAAILRFGGTERELVGSEPETTNNRMEMRGLIEGLRALKQPVHVLVHADSEYVINGLSQWIHGWLKRNWVKSNGKPVLNRDLWQELLEVARPHKLEFVQVKGHAGVELNERCDQLAVAAREELARQLAAAA